MRKKLAATAFLAWAALYGTAWGQECSQTIEGNDLIQYNLAEIRVSANCGEFTVNLRHMGQLPANVMGHNWVLTRTEDYMAVAAAAQAVGPPQYLPDGDPRVIGATSMIGGGDEVTVTFDISELEAGGDYTYFCSFPGHYVLMNGKFIVE
jgi:azurin